MFESILLMLCIYNAQTMTFLTFTGDQALASFSVSLDPDQTHKTETETETKLLETKTETTANWP